MDPDSNLTRAMGSRHRQKYESVKVTRLQTFVGAFLKKIVRALRFKKPPQSIYR